MALRYPRCIHSELMTHRVFSRNASSSRAIPLERMIADVEKDPYIPLFWGANKPGMQAAEELTGHDREVAITVWKSACAAAIHHARAYLTLPVMPHKQNPNRILEPFAHISVLVTSTQWANWFALRRHPAAEPHIRMLADAMYAAMNASLPTELPDDGWHLPYIDRNGDEIDHAAIRVLEDCPGIGACPSALESEIFHMLAKVSVARCARVSYNNHDGTTPRIEKDLKLYEDLIESDPAHASPAEHQAQPDRLFGPNWERPDLHGNFVGWRQYRKHLSHESVKDKPYTGLRTAS